MPKLFTISVGIEEIAVGRVMRLLHNTPGVARVDVDMGAPKANGSIRDGSGSALVQTILKNGGLPRNAIAEAFKHAGRSPKSINSVLHNMSKSKVIVKKDGKWVLR